MQDNIPEALIAAFERQYDTSWNDPQLRNERMAMRYGWVAAIESRQCLVQISEPEAEVWPCVNIDVDESGNVTNAKLYSPGLPAGNHDVYPVRVPYIDEHSEAWLACAAELEKASPGFMSLGNMNGIECAVAAIRDLAARAALAATPAAAPAGWKLVPIEPTSEMLESAGAADRDGTPATYKTLYMAMVGAALNPPHACDTPRYCNSVQRCTAMDEQRAAAAPVVLPEPGAWSESLAALVAQVDAGSTADYRALQEHRVMRSARALLAQAATTGVAAPASLGPALYSIDADPEGIRARVADAITGALAFGAQNSGKPPAGHWLAPFWTQARFGVIQFNALRDSAYALLNAPAVEQGEVLVTVSGFTGSGKSAIAGEIEILCRALGLQVQWPDGDSEKNMTHADWTAALEQYKPCVRIVEQNIPFASKKGLSK